MTIAKTPTEVETDVLARFTALTGKTLLAADPRRLLLDSIIEKLSHLYSLIELADLRNLPFDATGQSLTNLGTFVGVTASPGEASVTTVRYTRTTSLVALVIPAGHRTTTPDGAYIWATDEALTLGIGTLTGTVTATCTVTGPESNSLAPGAIDTLVDPIAGVTAANTTTTAGGSDEQTDDEFRPSVIAAPDGFTTCGPRSAYVWHAKAANTYVFDASCLGPDDTDYLAPAAGEVAIFLLLAYLDDDGALVHVTDAGVIAAIIAIVEAALSADEVRPIGDLVTVAEAVPVAYTVEVEYYIPQSEAANVAAIQAAVEAAQDAYMDWQESAIGRDIDPSELHDRLYQAGARRINIISPVWAEIERSEVALRDDYVAAPLYKGLFQ